jgi:hypothetical protein
MDRSPRPPLRSGEGESGVACAGPLARSVYSAGKGQPGPHLLSRWSTQGASERSTRITGGCPLEDAQLRAGSETGRGHSSAGLPAPGGRAAAAVGQ